jgi:hypothetical protein
MFVLVLYMKFHIPSSNSSLVVAIQPETKENVHMAAILSLYIL